MHGKTWGLRGQTPVVHRPGQRRSISAASAINAHGSFWFCTYQGALDGERFVDLLTQLIRHRKRGLHLIVDSLPAHKKAVVKDYVHSIGAKLTLHFLPGYAPDLKSRRIGLESCQAHRNREKSSATGGHLQDRIDAELLALQRNRPLVRSFFRAPSAAYISDC